MFTDTHSHIYLEDFDKDINEIIGRSISNKITRILLPNIDSSSVSRMMKLAEMFPDVCYPMIGLHPTSVKSNWKEEISKLENLFDKFNFVGIGEIGIDLYWDKTYLSEQIEAFEYQIDLAQKRGTAFVIHARDSFEEIFNVLEKNYKDPYNGIFHAFSGSANDGRKAIEMGFKIGIGGVVTYKNSGLDRTIKEIGYKDIVLETDSPYLTPVPFRGKRNESSYIIYIIEKLCDIFGITQEELSEVTERNVASVFKL